MSAPIEDLRRVARISRREHLAIFDHYIALGRDIETLAIKFGYNPPDIITILEGYGETVCEGIERPAAGTASEPCEGVCGAFLPGDRIGESGKRLDLY